MPEEKTETPQETPETMPAETSASGQSMRTRFESLITDPYAVLGLLVYALVIGGLLHAMADAFGWDGGGVKAFFNGFLNDIWVASGAVGFTLGMIAIVHGIRTRKGGDGPKVPSSMSNSMLDPVRLFTFAPWVFAALGIIKALYDLVTLEIAFEALAFRTTSLLFYVSAGFFLMIALRIISDWLHSDPSSASAASASATTSAAETEPDGDGSEKTTEPASSSTSFADSLKNLTSDANRTLMFGVYLTAYLGVASLLFIMWRLFDSNPNSIWNAFFTDIALIGVAVGFLMIARPLVNWIIGNEVTGGEIQQAEGETRSAWLQRVTGNPMHVINIGTIVILLSVFPFYLIQLWSNRNTPVINFWSELLGITLLVIVIVGALLVLRSTAMIVLSGSSTPIGQRLKLAADGPLMSDPGQLLRILVYLIAFVGLGSVCLTVWWWQGEAVWQIWYQFLNEFGFMLVSLAMALGGKAIYAEISD